MFRFIREYFHPSLRCMRIGHNYKDKSVKIRKKSLEWREVAADYKAKITVCLCCGRIKDKPFDLEKIDWYSSCSMPNHMWDTIRENGYLILST